MIDLEWMAWTPLTAAFFGAIGSMLICMTIWEIASPTHRRRGWLPMATTRGDRLFVGLLASAFVHLAWLAGTDGQLWPASGLSLLLLVLIVRFG